jgi:hypothetical protein
MTLGEIRNASPRPCEPGWKKLIAACGTSDDGHVVDLRDILKSNGPKDAWWATRCLPLREQVSLALRALAATWATEAEAATWAAAMAATWDRLGEIMREWCAEQDTEVRR